ncbi:universal stress protein [Streptomyces sp. ISL-22]|uniref:universal stress protein n=1 Tax=unclassified Streptomyces TaxID=2593676 RepID=UPI001BE5CEF2|nr:MULTISPECIES: universal stress protein [unclassified Streptomyces]MBT2422253.1 universal stress protein [Streptomyces sp. ISL-24]MBT2435864.1 universal stress protein [Streptomyces sp. ISL-22]
MSVIVWITEGTWPACVDAARSRTAPDEETVLLYVHDDTVAATAHGAFAGLLGRGHPRGHGPADGWGSDPGTRVEQLAAASARQLLRAAADRLGRPCARVERAGRVEREVVAAVRAADLLICARDGDPTRLGPHSLGHAARFVVDHAPCPVLLVWPGEAPHTPASAPPPPGPPSAPPPPGPPSATPPASPPPAPSSPPPPPGPGHRP